MNKIIINFDYSNRNFYFFYYLESRIKKNKNKKMGCSCCKKKKQETSLKDNILNYNTKHNIFVASGAFTENQFNPKKLNPKIKDKLRTTETFKSQISKKEKLIKEKEKEEVNESFNVAINDNKLNCNLRDEYFSLEELEYYKTQASTHEKRQRSYEVNFNSMIKKGEVIGEGGYGKVFLGFDEIEGRVVAVKEIKLSSYDSDQGKRVS